MSLATVTQGFPLQEYLNVHFEKKMYTLKAEYGGHICQLNI